MVESKAENVENKGLIMKEFEEMWDKAQETKRGFRGIIDYNVVVDVSETEIKADDYLVEVNEGENSSIFLYYKTHKIAKIKLKYIKRVY
jgi:hypothetical protein